jgi:hypothetical protein
METEALLRACPSLVRMLHSKVGAALLSLDLMASEACCSGDIVLRLVAFAILGDSSAEAQRHLLSLRTPAKLRYSSALRVRATVKRIHSELFHCVFDIEDTELHLLMTALFGGCREFQCAMESSACPLVQKLYTAFKCMLSKLDLLHLEGSIFAEHGYEHMALALVTLYILGESTEEAQHRVLLPLVKPEICSEVSIGEVQRAIFESSGYCLEVDENIIQVFMEVVCSLT